MQYLELPVEILHNRVLGFLSIRELVSLDKACVNQSDFLRGYILNKKVTLHDENEDWFSKRDIILPWVTVLSSLNNFSMFRRTHSLSVYDTEHISNILVSCNKHLTTLFLAPSTLLTENDCDVFGQYCPNVATLSISTGHSPTMPATTIQAIIRGSPALTKLDLSTALGDSTCTVNSAVMSCVWKHCVLLKELRVNSCSRLTDKSMSGLANKTTQLQLVNISDVSEVTDKGYKVLFAATPHLRAINLSGTSISPNGLTFMFQHCPLLETVDLMMQTVNNACMFALAENVPNLKMLKLNIAHGLTDEALSRIVRACTKLEALMIAGCNIGSAGIASIALHCKNLVTLFVWGNEGVTDESVRSIGEHCTKLKRLKVSKNVSPAVIDSLCAKGITVNDRDITNRFAL